MPQIAANGDGASVVWTVNSENDIMGLTGRNSIMRADFDGTAWSAPTEVKSNLNAVTNITSGNMNGEFCIAYVTDDDNDILDSCPVFANNMIYYYSGRNISTVFN